MITSPIPRATSRCRCLRSSHWRGTRHPAAVFAFLALAIISPSHSEAAELTYVVHVPAEKTLHPPLILLLHGSGADERDMISLWPQLPADFVVVSPRAPFGDKGGGYRWYRKAMSGRASDVAISRKIIDTLVEDATTRFDADPRRIFIGGFSQGAVMVYDVALNEPGRFRGAVVLSGSLPPGDATGLATGPDRSQDAFFVGHGMADNRIPLAAATAARDALARLGVPVAFHVYPGMRHETGAAEIADLAHWLAERTGETPAVR